MSKDENIKITMETLKETAPDLLAQIENDAFTAGSEAGITDGMVDGTVAERARVMEILEADADPQQTRTAIKDGIAANAAFKSFYEAEKSKRAQGLTNMETEATEPAGVEEPAGDAPDNQTPAEKRRAWRPAAGPLA